jgi:hypothetical protein
METAWLEQLGELTIETHVVWEQSRCVSTHALPAGLRWTEMRTLR